MRYFLFWKAHVPLEVVSALTAEEAVRRLGAVVRPWGRRYRAPCAVGTVSAEGLIVARAHPWRQVAATQALFRGRLESRDGKTALVGCFGLSVLGAVLAWVLLCFTALGVVVLALAVTGYHEGPPREGAALGALGGALVGFPLLWAGLARWQFYSDVKWLTELLQAVCRGR